MEIGAIPGLRPGILDLLPSMPRESPRPEPRGGTRYWQMHKFKNIPLDIQLYAT